MGFQTTEISAGIDLAAYFDRIGYAGPHSQPSRRCTPGGRTQWVDSSLRISTR